MLLEREDPALVEPQAFPHGVATLDRAVEWAHAGLVAVRELAVHVDDQVAVPLVEFLLHRQSSGAKAQGVKLLIPGPAFVHELLLRSI